MRIIKRITWRDVRPGANPRVQLELDTRELITLRGALERTIKFRKDEELRGVAEGQSPGVMQILMGFTQEAQDLLQTFATEYDTLWAGVADEMPQASR
jgi:hypothetical protein